MHDLLEDEAKSLQSAQAARSVKPARPRGDSHLEREKQSGMQRLIRAIMDNSLTIVLFALFVVCIFAQTFAGWRLQNVTLAAHGQAFIAALAYQGYLGGVQVFNANVKSNSGSLKLS